MALSFAIPVSALNNHQKRIELLSENIANLNTPGFKGKRMTFLETLGSVAGVSQFEFKQGSITFTGRPTDLGIKGNSFFLLDSGEEKVYTRAGAFELNEKGELVNVDGFNVQGWMNNISANSSSLGSKSTKVEDIIIDPNLVMPAKATQNAYLSGNLNSGLESITEVWETGSAYTTKATLLSSGITFPLAVNAGVDDEFGLDLEDSLGNNFSETITLTAGSYADTDAVVTEINSQIASNANLTGKVEALNSGGTLKFRTIDGLADTKITLQSGTTDVLGNLGFVSGASSTSGANATTLTQINDLLQVTTDMVAGDALDIEGKDSAGNTITSTYTYADGNTLQDIVDVIDTAYAGYGDADIIDGKLILTDDLAGDSDTQISISAASGNTGLVTLPSFINSDEGFTGTVSTSVVIYDSLGDNHNLTLDFEKTENPGEWLWSASASGDETITAGSSGKVLFDSSGALVSFSFDNGATSLTLDPGNGSDSLDINIHAASEDGTRSISQFQSVSTLQVTDQDGIKSGRLDSFSIDTDGSILGAFTNGQETVLGQLAVAKFNNPSGLKKIGQSNFTTTDDSGIALIGKADSQDSEIKSESLEISTVDIADQFTQLIEAQNAYQAAAKVINTFEEVADQAARLKR